MKFLAFALVSLLGSLSFAGNDYQIFSSCSSPRIEGELQVVVAKDKKSALVIHFGVKTYVATGFNIGPVSNFDFTTAAGQERIIVAVDGFHELHKKVNGKYKKVAYLTCYSNY